MVEIRGWRLRVAVVLAGTAVAAGLAACSHPDLLVTLHADKPQDPRAVQECRTNPIAKQYGVAASDSTVSQIRPYAGKASDILDGRPQDQYVAICLLDVPESDLTAGGLPAETGPLTLAILTDRGPLWLS